MKLRARLWNLGRDFSSVVETGGRCGIEAATHLAERIDAGARGAFRAAASATKTVRVGAKAASSAVAAGVSRVDGTLSRTTGVELAWCHSILRFGVSLSLVSGRGAIRRHAQSWLHPDHSSHLEAFAAVNGAMDNGGKWAHRLRYGHSLEWLPSLISKCGWTTVAAYPIHLAQDITTDHGIPVIPWAGHIYNVLLRCGVKPTVALRLLSVNLGGVVLAAGTILAFVTIAHLVREASRQDQVGLRKFACC